MAKKTTNTVPPVIRASIRRNGSMSRRFCRLRQPWDSLLATSFAVSASQSAGGQTMPAVKKSTSAKKTASKKSSGRKYSPKASKSVEREMRAMKEGKLKSGSGQKVTNPKQAIAIGLSEARKSGAKMPPAPEKSSAKS